jgi:hypothetical protein
MSKPVIYLVAWCSHHWRVASQYDLLARNHPLDTSETTPGWITGDGGVVQSGPTRARSLVRLVNGATPAEHIGIASRARCGIDPGTRWCLHQVSVRSNLIYTGWPGRLLTLAHVPTPSCSNALVASLNSCPPIIECPKWTWCVRMIEHARTCRWQGLACEVGIYGAWWLNEVGTALSGVSALGGPMVNAGPRPGMRI